MTGRQSADVGTHRSKKNEEKDELGIKNIDYVEGDEEYKIGEMDNLLGGQKKINSASFIPITKKNNFSQQNENEDVNPSSSRQIPTSMSKKMEDVQENTSEISKDL
jgi:hypothetical protein